MVLRYARENEGVFVNDCVLFQRKHESLRGPPSEQARATDTIDKWIKYDTLIFEEIDRKWNLDEFRPFRAGAAPPRDETIPLAAESR